VHEAARVHRRSRWRGGDAVSYARAAVGDSGDRSSQHRLSERLRTHRKRIPAGLEGNRLCRWAKCSDRIRWAEGQNDLLPAMAADLVRRQVAVIVATSAPAALAAKAATATIPIVFETGADPVGLGLVASLSQPGGNITGVTQTNVEMAPKRLQLLYEVIPAAKVMGLLVNPTDGVLAESYTKEVQAAARSLGLELHVLNASSERDLDGVFARLSHIQVKGLVISGGAFLTSHSEQLAVFAIRHAMPTIFQSREFAVAGGLLSYGAAITEAYRLAGSYAGRILKGEKPANLPVQQATKVAMYINLKTAKALGIALPVPLLGRADEVIE
jgi:putative tryptophan/tyrosine transport system substrate-binding protein